MPGELLTRQTTANPRRIISFCGKKQSGKNSAANFVGGMLLYSYYYIDSFQLTHDGILINGALKNINDVAPKFLKIYHWADELKMICHKMFNIPLELLYGTDEDKSTLTNLYWENMPGVMTNKKLFQLVYKFVDKKIELLGQEYADSFNVIYHDPGQMSVREVIQFFGTDIGRKMLSDCWINTLQSTIKKEAPTIAIIADTRFDNECCAIESWGGLNIKMNRKILSDSHASENGVVKFDRWSAIVKNEKTDTIPQFCEILHKTLRPIGVFKEVS